VNSINALKAFPVFIMKAAAATQVCLKLPTQTHKLTGYVADVSRTPTMMLNLGPSKQLIHMVFSNHMITQVNTAA